MPSCAYYKKQIIPLEEAKMGVMTHAFHYGTGVFEGIRGNWNKSKEQLYLFRLKEHFERMLDGCHALRINLTYSLSELSQITMDMVKKCAFREDIYVRPVAYKSSEALGVRLHGLEDDFLVFAFPWGPYLDVETAKCAVSSWRRPKETPQGKINGLYVSAALAKSEAVGNGFDEAIMLTPDGFVAEGSGENIFLVKEGKLITPATYDYILKGITRDSVMKLAKNDLHIETEERHVERGELYSADEVFLTGTAANITPVGEIDRRKIGDGGVGKTTRALQQLYADVIQGKNHKYLDWCTPVYEK